MNGRDRRRKAKDKKLKLEQLKQKPKEKSAINCNPGNKPVDKLRFL